MCGSISQVKNVGNWLGGPYQVFPIDNEVVSESVESPDIGKLKGDFPDSLEAFCAWSFVVAGAENQKWAGATYDYLDRLASGVLRRQYNRIVWRMLGGWIFSLGRTNCPSKADLIILFTHGFTGSFWKSMKRLINRGYVRVEKRSIDDVDHEVFYPTPRLLHRITH